MGASEFDVTVSATTAEKAFSAAVEEARYESGHAGYTGTIAEKHSFKILSNGCRNPLDFIEKVVEDESHGYGDKYGPALCVCLGPDEANRDLKRFRFFGLASS